MSDKEVRVLELDVSKLRVEKREDGSSNISGYAAVFDKDSEDMGFIERIDRKAFNEAIPKSDVRGLQNHDPNFIFARSGVNLTLKADKVGLHMDVSPLTTSTYKMVEENIRSGLITQQSFAFTVDEDEWNEDFTRRTIKKIGQIFDVSVVTYPAYADTSVALRSMESAKEKIISKETKQYVYNEDKKIAYNDGKNMAIPGDEGNVSGGESPTSASQTDTDPESRTDSGGESPTSALQTVEELEARFQQKLLNYKGLF